MRTDRERLLSPSLTFRWRWRWRGSSSKVDRSLAEESAPGSSGSRWWAGRLEDRPLGARRIEWQLLVLIANRQSRPSADIR